MSIGHDYISVYRLAIDPITPSTVYAGTNVDVFRSADSGVTWTVVKPGIVSRDVTSLAIDPKTPSTLYAGFTYSGVFRYDSRSLASRKIVLQIGKSAFTVDGTSKTLDSPPVIKNARTLVPIRAIIEALGGTVGWDESARKAAVALGGTTIELWIGKGTAAVNGVSTRIDAAGAKVVPEIISGRIMLPLRFVSENLGCSIVWVNATRTITMTYQL